MAKATVASLNERERLLVAETERDHLRGLDEDALIELLARVRRARDRAVGLHRREVAAQVGARGARGKASTAPRRSAGKAEIFEDALARVSTALAVAARKSAAELRADRLAQANATAPKPTKKKPTTKKAAAKPKPITAAKRPPGGRKAVASQRAEGARRQARRDAR